MFVSVDPRRDTPQLLTRYVSNFGNDTVAARGGDAALRRYCDTAIDAVPRQTTDFL